MARKEEEKEMMKSQDSEHNLNKMWTLFSPSSFPFCFLPFSLFFFYSPVMAGPELTAQYVLTSQTQ
jgi:hypothetical protein